MFELRLLVLARYRIKLSSAKSFGLYIHTKFHMKRLSNFSDETCEQSNMQYIEYMLCA